MQKNEKFVKAAAAANEKMAKAKPERENESIMEAAEAETSAAGGGAPKKQAKAAGAKASSAKKEAGKGFIDTADNLYKFFVDRVRDRLHVCLCFSPIGEKFRNRARMFPGLFAC